MPHSLALWPAGPPLGCTQEATSLGGPGGLCCLAAPPGKKREDESAPASAQGARSEQGWGPLPLNPPQPPWLFLAPQVPENCVVHFGRFFCSRCQAAGRGPGLPVPQKHPQPTGALSTAGPPSWGASVLRGISLAASPWASEGLCPEPPSGCPDTICPVGCGPRAGCPMCHLRQKHVRV